MLEDEIDPQVAREWWRALMENAVSLVEDAAQLLTNDSPGRARSLSVLALEELAKAKWLYESARFEWTAGIGMPGYETWSGQCVAIPEQMLGRCHPHSEKLKAAQQFASGLDGFWGVDDRATYYFPADLETFKTTAAQLNQDKQMGFYVDRVDGKLLAPEGIPVDGATEFLQGAALTIEMHLIEDHTRQQDVPDVTRIDSSQDLHWRILEFAHPEEFFDFVSRATRADPSSKNLEDETDEA